MRKLLMILIALFTVNLAFASFPVKRVQDNAEVVTQSVTSDDVSAGEMMFTDATGSSFHIGGFALGFLLGLIGVALAYIFSKDQSLRTSSWYGLLAIVVLLLIL